MNFYTITARIENNYSFDEVIRDFTIPLLNADQTADGEVYDEGTGTIDLYCNVDTNHLTMAIETLTKLGATTMTVTVD